MLTNRTEQSSSIRGGTTSKYSMMMKQLENLRLGKDREKSSTLTTLMPGAVEENSKRLSNEQTQTMWTKATKCGQKPSKDFAKVYKDQVYPVLPRMTEVVAKFDLIQSRSTMIRNPSVRCYRQETQKDRDRLSSGRLWKTPTERNLQKLNAAPNSFNASTSGIPGAGSG